MPRARAAKPKLPEFDFTQLRTGLYRLTQDVSNPTPDRRARHDWTAVPTFEAGQQLTFRITPLVYNDLPDGVEPPNPPHFRYEIAERGNTKWVTLRKRPDLRVPMMDALGPHLEAIPVDVVALYDLHDLWHFHAHIVVKRLLDAGKITMEDLAEVLAMEGDLTTDSALFHPPLAPI